MSSIKVWFSSGQIQESEEKKAKNSPRPRPPCSPRTSCCPTRCPRSERTTVQSATPNWIKIVSVKSEMRRESIVLSFFSDSMTCKFKSTIPWWGGRWQHWGPTWLPPDSEIHVWSSNLDKIRTGITVTMIHMTDGSTFDSVKTKVEKSGGNNGRYCF